MTDHQAHWEHVYATRSENEVSWFQTNPAISTALIEAAGATRDAAIIDIGGGASRLVDNLLQKGFRSVTVLDLSHAALAAARARIGADANKVEWIAADVTRWTPARKYDIWHDRAAFHFLTDAADQAAYVRCLKSTVPSGGQAIIGTFALDGPEKCSGLPVQRYDSEALQLILGTEFALMEAHKDMHTTPWGSTQSFQFARFKRN